MSAANGALLLRPIRVGGPMLDAGATHQRLGLAAALIGDPQVLILDEPINGRLT